VLYYQIPGLSVRGPALGGTQTWLILECVGRATIRLVAPADRRLREQWWRGERVWRLDFFLQVALRQRVTFFIVSSSGGIRA
jgi:hypothetical protein